MKSAIASLAICVLAGCYVEEGRIETKSMVDDMRQNCNKTYTYLRYRLEDGEGNDIDMNLRIPKAQVDRCKIEEATACIRKKDGGIAKIDLGNPENEDYKLGKSTVRGRLTSEINTEKRQDMLAMHCDENNNYFWTVKYYAGLTIIEEDGETSVDMNDTDIWRFTQVNEDAVTEGEKLDNYQDSLCFPESGSQCDAP